MVVVYIFLGLIALLLIIANWMPKTYNIEKTMVIDKDVPTVMSRVGNLKYYSIWNPWQQSDSSVQNTITGTALEPQHSYSWNGKKVGQGSLTLRTLDNKHIHFDLEFLKPWKAKAKDNWLFEAWGDKETKVTWQNSGDLPWPIARLMGPLVIKNLNVQFDKGLKNLKSMCENIGS